MRRRLRSLRPRSMARRAGDDERFHLSPRALRLGGWLAALLLMLGIALGVRILGGNADGVPVGGASSGSAGAADLPQIAFGTALDPETGRVAETAGADRFAAGDTFAYSVAPAGSIPEAVYVEVRRAETSELVQEPVDAQVLPDPAVIAFRVPADDLLAVFGAGEYVMLIYDDPAGEPLAEGTFELVGPGASPSAGT